MQYYADVEWEFTFIDVQKYLYEKWDVVCLLK